MVTLIGAAVAIFVIALAGSALLTLQLVRKAEADYPPAGGNVDVEGMRLHYLDRGQGRPVILIHGLRGSAYDFEVSISEGLARDHRLSRSTAQATATAIGYPTSGSRFSSRPNSFTPPR
jgi:hypothetical protein